MHGSVVISRIFLNTIPSWLLSIFAAPLCISWRLRITPCWAVGINRSGSRPFPSLALPSGLFPKTEAVLRSHGLWQNRVRMKRFRPELWQGRTEDQVTLTYASSLALQAMPGLVRLDYDLGLISGEALVVRRDLQHQPSLQELKAWLVHRCESLAGQFPDLQLAAEA